MVDRSFAGDRVRFEAAGADELRATKSHLDLPLVIEVDDPAAELTRLRAASAARDA